MTGGQGMHTFKASFHQEQQTFSANFGEVHVVEKYIGGEPYMGPYEITPKVDQQKMETKGKVLNSDVTVKAIPFFEVSNTSGGNTVYIAKEI